ncbi:glycosyl hydrolase family 28-related protein [Vibrio sp. NTOU-M3]|uniref:glycosyl hydrolase family 28-related protein n=1 Tax=Vibrio sp. NTOU-M3 TaxID=3234954 RepID=UPI00349F5596
MSTTNIKQSFFTLQDLINCTSLSEGDVAETLGYHDLNDGGGATYAIIKGSVEHKGADIELGRELIAQLVCSGPVNPKQFGAIGDGETDDTDAVQSAFDYAVDRSIIIDDNPNDGDPKRSIYFLTMHIPSGIYLIKPLTIANVNGLSIVGDGNRATIFKSALSGAGNLEPLFKFLPGTYEGAAVSGFTLSNIGFKAPGYLGPIVQISSIWDSCRLQELSFDGFSGNALRFLKRADETPNAYRYVEGVVIEQCYFLGDNKKQGFLASAPLVEFPEGGNEVSILNSKLYIQTTATTEMNTPEALNEYNSRSAIKAGPFNKGWEINGCSFACTINAKVIDIEDGNSHRIYGNMFERIGEYTEGQELGFNPCLIHWSNCANGGLIENNRREHPVSLKKHYILNACNHIVVNEFNMDPSKVDLSTAHQCPCTFASDQTIGYQSVNNLPGNVIASNSGSWSNISNALRITQRDTTGSAQEDKNYPTLQFSTVAHVINPGEEHLTAKADATASLKLKHSSNRGELHISSKGHKDEQDKLAAVISNGYLRLAHNNGLPENPADDAVRGSFRYDAEKDRLLFKTSSGWKVVNLLDL